jgi:PDZ domain-containing protein
LARRILSWAGAVATVALAVSLNFYHLPVVTLLPGPVEDVLPQVKVADGTKTYEAGGHLYLTTVGVDDKVNFYEALLDFADRDVEVVPREVVYPKDRSEQEVDLQNAAEMDDSKLAATVVGLRAAGYRVDTHPDGVRVVGVVPGSAADGRLKPEDRLLALGGRKLGSADELRKRVAGAAIGSRLELQVQRGRQTLTVRVSPTAPPSGPSRAYLGVSLSDIHEFPVEVQIDTKNIGGPSAGLMFSLSIVEKLGPQDLTGDRDIAGTGTVDLDGRVGPIGGIRQKLIAAKRIGAKVFLLPRENLAEARRGAPRDLTLVPVGTVDDALAFLRGAPAARAATPAG